MPNAQTARQPAVAGRFYTAVATRLRAEITGWCAEPAAPRAKACGVMVPHAGYMYSGRICGRALASVEIPPLCLILHTRHQIGGGPLSLAVFKEWQTPLGAAPTDPAFQAALAATDGISTSNLPHYGEHAAEVVVPFLQVLRPDVRVAVISVAPAPHADLRGAAAGLARAILAHPQEVLVIASTDMNHYADQETTLAKDRAALDKLAANDAAGLLEACERYDITMCGVHATALMLETCRELGATRVEILEHTTSGDVSGDHGQVVGYASARVL